MLTEAALVFVLTSTFYWTSSWSSMSFALSLWLLYLCLAGFFAIHPAVCSQIFDPGPSRHVYKVSLNTTAVSWDAGVDVVAIGLICSGDVVNNLLIGALSPLVLRYLGWAGFFPVLSVFALTAAVLAAFFPRRSLKHSDGNFWRLCRCCCPSRTDLNGPSFFCSRTRRRPSGRATRTSTCDHGKATGSSEWATSPKSSRDTATSSESPTTASAVPSTASTDHDAVGHPNEGFEM